MQIQPEITFKEFTPSDALTARIQEWVGKLEHVYSGIIRCQVVVEMPHRHHRQGRQFHVRIRLTVPGVEIVASHDPGPDETHEDPYVAVRDAFTATRRQLEDYVRRPRADYGKLRTPRVGSIVELDIDGSGGWLESEAHRVRFERDVVAGGIEHVSIGDEVQFMEQDGLAVHVAKVGAESQEVTSLT